MGKQIQIYKSKEGAYFTTRYIIPVGKYNADHITYQQGTPMGNTIFFDSRNFVMEKAEFENNFVLKDGDGE